MSNKEGNIAADSLYLPMLLREVERQYGIEPRTPAHFDELADKITRRAGDSLSVSTIKRLWGYVERGRKPHLSTLNVLARAVGYAGFTEFCRSSNSKGHNNSHFSSAQALDVNTLTPGERLIINWLPDRQLRIRYLEGYNFEIEESLNSKLKPGYKIACMITPGEPLVLQVTDPRTGQNATYVCGTEGGVSLRMAEQNSEQEPTE